MDNFELSTGDGKAIQEWEKLFTSYQQAIGPVEGAVRSPASHRQVTATIEGRRGEARVGRPYSAGRSGVEGGGQGGRRGMRGARGDRRTLEKLGGCWQFLRREGSDLRRGAGIDDLLSRTEGFRKKISGQ